MRRWWPRISGARARTRAGGRDTGRRAGGSAVSMRSTSTGCEAGGWRADRPPRQDGAFPPAAHPGPAWIFRAVRVNICERSPGSSGWADSGRNGGATAACRQAGFEPPPPACRSPCRSSRGARLARQHATYRWLGIDVSRRRAAPRERADAPSSAARPRSPEFEARVIALQARGDHGR